MYVTATEFRTNVGKYLELMSKEDIFISRYGKSIGILSASEETKQKMVDSLKGSLKIDREIKAMTDEELDDFIFKERMKDYESLG